MIKKRTNELDTIIRNISDARRHYDEFLTRNKNNEYIYFFSSLVRELYIAFHEPLPQNKSYKIKSGTWVQIITNCLFIILKTPYLSKNSKIIIIEINKEKDMPLAKKLQIPTVKILYKWKINIYNVKYIIQFIKTAYVLLHERTLDKRTVIRILPSMLSGINAYYSIQLDGIEKIITQRDRYPTELAIITKANQKKIITIKIDTFIIMGPYCQDKIYCKYYYYPNEISRKYFQDVHKNDSVIFIRGGFPFWDDYSIYRYAPAQNPKNILFFTQYGYHAGLFGSYSPYDYILEILSVMPEDYLLYIKKHPLDQNKNYEKLKKIKNVAVIEETNIDNSAIISKSSFVFSINSQSCFESKHICPHTYFINYEQEKAFDFEFNMIKGYIDVITNKKDLKQLFFKNKKPASMRKYIDYFNPMYPDAVKTLKNFIQKV
ncbi:hypothetical protein ACFL6D_01320 [Spirochaetota bacterium]